MMESVTDMKMNEGALMSTDQVFMQIYDSSSKAVDKIKDVDSQEVNSKIEAVKAIENETILEALEKEENLDNEKNEEGVLKRKLSEVCHNEDCTFFGKLNPHVFLAKCPQNSEDKDVTDNGNEEFTIKENKSVSNLEPPNKKIKIYRGVEVKSASKESNGDSNKVDQIKCSKETHCNEKEDLKNNESINNLKIMDRDHKDGIDDKKEELKENNITKVIKEIDKKNEITELPDDEDKDDELLYDGDEEDDEDFDDDNDNILDTEIKSTKVCSDVVQISSGESNGEEEDEDEDEDDDSREDEDELEEDEKEIQKKFSQINSQPKIQHKMNSKSATSFLAVDKKADTPHLPLYPSHLSDQSLSNQPLPMHPLSNHPLNNHPSLYQHHTDVSLPSSHLSDHQRPLPSNLPKPTHYHPDHHSILPNQQSLAHHLNIFDPHHHQQATGLLDSHLHYDAHHFECGMMMFDVEDLHAGKAQISVVSIEHLAIGIHCYSTNPSSTRVPHSNVAYWKWLPMFGVKVLEVVVNGSMENLFEFFKIPLNVFQSMSLPSVSTLTFFFADDKLKPHMEASFEAFFMQPKLTFPPHLKPYSFYNGHPGMSEWGGEDNGSGRKKHHAVLCRRSRRFGTFIPFYRPLVFPYIKLVSNPLYFPQHPSDAYIKNFNNLKEQQHQQQLSMQYYNNNKYNNNEMAFQQHMPLSAYSSHFSHNNNFSIPMQHPDQQQHHHNKMDNIYNLFSNNNVNKPHSPTPVVSGFTGKNIKLFTYQPSNSKGGIGISNEDLFCLNDGEYLNDVIIDFYLKYLMEEIVSPEDKDATHIFSSFFYSHLISNSNNNNSNLTSAEEQRHSKVKRWTRNVDIFSKDFIIVPINESYHWFLAIICFPNERNKRTRTNADKLPPTTTTTAVATKANTTASKPTATTSIAAVTTATNATAENEPKSVTDTALKDNDMNPDSTVTSVGSDNALKILDSSSFPAISKIFSVSSLKNLLSATPTTSNSTSCVTTVAPNEATKNAANVGVLHAISSRSVVSFPSSSASSLVTFSASITPSSTSSTDVMLLKSDEENNEDAVVGGDDDERNIVADEDGGDGKNVDGDDVGCEDAAGGEEGVGFYGDDSVNGDKKEEERDGKESKGDVTNVNKDHCYKKNNASVVDSNGDGGLLQNGGKSDEGNKGDNMEEEDDSQKVDVKVVEKEDEDERLLGKTGTEVVCEDVYVDYKLGDVVDDDADENCNINNENDGDKPQDNEVKGAKVGDNNEKMVSGGGEVAPEVGFVDGKALKEIIEDVVEKNNDEFDKVVGTFDDGSKVEKKGGCDEEVVKENALGDNSISNKELIANVCLIKKNHSVMASESEISVTTVLNESHMDVEAVADISEVGNVVVEGVGNKIKEGESDVSSVCKDIDEKMDCNDGGRSLSGDDDDKKSDKDDLVGGDDDDDEKSDKDDVVGDDNDDKKSDKDDVFGDDKKIDKDNVVGDDVSSDNDDDNMEEESDKGCDDEEMDVDDSLSSVEQLSMVTASADLTIASTSATINDVEINKSNQTTLIVTTLSTTASTSSAITTASEVTKATTTTSEVTKATTTTSIDQSTVPTITAYTKTTVKDENLSVVTDVDLTDSPAKQQGHPFRKADSEDANLNQTKTTTTAAPTTTTTTTTKNTPTPESYDEATPSRNPCILIFDSLKGENRFDVVNILRQYLQVEWNTRKRDTEGERSFERMNMKGAMVNCPQQSNTTDCGIYMLQFVESFFRDKVENFTLPVHLDDWFKTQEVMSKRLKLARLIMSLKGKNNPDLVYNPHDDGCFNIASLSDDDDDDEVVEDDDDEEEEEEEEDGEEFSSVGDYVKDEESIKRGKYDVSDDNEDVDDEDDMGAGKDGDGDDYRNSEMIKDTYSLIRGKKKNKNEDGEMDLDSDREEVNASSGIKSKPEIVEMCSDIIEQILDGICNAEDNNEDDDCMGDEDDDIDNEGNKAIKDDSIKDDSIKDGDMNIDREDNSCDSINKVVNIKFDDKKKDADNDSRDDCDDNDDDSADDDKDIHSFVSENDKMSEKASKFELEEEGKVILNKYEKVVMENDSVDVGMKGRDV